MMCGAEVQSRATIKKFSGWLQFDTVMDRLFYGPKSI
jgi:hypothetical protein